MISRGFFTKHLITELGTFALPVGDNDAPTEAHGWVSDNTQFIPWSVLSPGTAAKSDSALGASQQDWRLNYFVTSAGVSREQCESVADKIRNHLKALEKVSILLKDENWKLTYVYVLSIGNVQRIGATNPPYHLQTDTFEFWLSKE